MTKQTFREIIGMDQIGIEIKESLQDKIISRS